MEPATHIIKQFGGVQSVQKITGVHVTRVYNWMRSKDEGGTGGTIPFRHVPKLLNAAREMGVEISADDFLPTTQEASA
jgi:transposase